MKRKRLRLYISVLALLFFGAVIVSGVWLWRSTSSDFVYLVSVVGTAPQTGEVLYADEKGAVFDRASSSVNFRPVAFSEIDTVLNADLIALEDRNFENHYGVDVWRTLRATLHYVFTLGFVTNKRPSGGSTLTQQLIKNLLAHTERSLLQKIQEIVLALRLESAMTTLGGRAQTKRQILTAYWNELFVSHRYRGLAYFADFVLNKKSVSSFTASERMLVLALVRSPSALAASEKSLADSVSRIGVALQRLGRLSSNEIAVEPTQARSWFRRYILTRSSWSQIVSPAVPMTSLGKSIGNLFGLNPEQREYFRSQSIVRTARMSALDGKMQQRLDIRLKELNSPARAECAVTGAYMLVRLEDAAVVAAGEDRCSEFNELVQSRRQVSSTIKPFLYAFALETLDLNAASLFTDRRVTVTARDGKLYSPGNHYKTFRGSMNLKTALQISANTVSLQLFEKINGDLFNERISRAFARYPGDDVATQLHTDYSLALGTVDLSPVHVAAAYTTLLSRGKKRYPHWGTLYTQANPSVGKILPAANAEPHVFEGRAAEQVREMLTAVLRPEGTGGELFGAEKGIVIQELGAKSGSGAVDSWFVGYSQDLLLLVWLGFRERTPRQRDFHAANLWYDLFLATLPYFKPRPMTYSPELKRRYFCAATGDAPKPGCRRIMSAIFSQ